MSDLEPCAAALPWPLHILAHDLERARELQLQMLRCPTIPQLPKHHLHFSPARGVGGDLYHLTTLGTDNRWVVCTVADALGKGVSAALIMSLMLASVREITRHSFEPSEVLEQLHRRLCEAFPRSEPCYVAACVVTIDRQTHQVLHATAGHEPPLWYSQQSRRVTILERNGPLLGVLARPCYTQGLVQAAPGDRLIAFTDGITDARDDDLHPFTAERLLELVERFGHLDVHRLGDLLVSSQRAFATCPEQQDDEALLIMEVE